MHSTAQHSTAQHSTAQHSTAQHSTAQMYQGRAAGPALLEEACKNECRDEQVNDSEERQESLLHHKGVMHGCDAEEFV